MKYLPYGRCEMFAYGKREVFCLRQNVKRNSFLLFHTPQAYFICHAPAWHISLVPKERISPGRIWDSPACGRRFARQNGRPRRPAVVAVLQVGRESAQPARPRRSIHYRRYRAAERSPPATCRVRIPSTTPKKKATQRVAFFFGDGYGIRTHECQRERLVS